MTLHPELVTNPWQRKRGSTPLGGKQEEECTSGHKNLEDAEKCENVTGFGAQGLLLLAFLLFVWLVFGFV